MMVLLVVVTGGGDGDGAGAGGDQSPRRSKSEISFPLLVGGMIFLIWGFGIQWIK